MNTVNGVVATVLTEQQLAINVGSNDGVAIGQQVTLYETVEIKDPTNPKIVLGVARVRKANLVIESVQPKFSIAKLPSANPFLRGVIDQPVIRFVNSELAGNNNRTAVTVGDPVTVQTQKLNME